MSRFVDGVLYLGSGEFLLDERPNGGTVIFLRAVITATVIYALALAIRARLAPEATWCPSGSAARVLIHDTVGWFGAIFAATYAALYARFASQWAYLANLYNEIKSAEVRMASGEGPKKALAAWKAGFIEDAEEVHLHTKAVHAAVIVNWLEDPAIREAYEKDVPGSTARLERVEAQARAAVNRRKRMTA